MMGQKAKTFYAIDSPFFLFMEGLGGFGTKKAMKKLVLKHLTRGEHAECVKVRRTKSGTNIIEEFLVEGGTA